MRTREETSRRMGLTALLELVLSSAGHAWPWPANALSGSGEKVFMSPRVKGQMFAIIAWPGRVEKAGVPCSSQSFSQKGELLKTSPSSLPDFSSGWK